MAKLTVATARKLKPGRYSDDDRTGLYLQISGPEQRAWLYRYQRNGKQRIPRPQACRSRAVRGGTCLMAEDAILLGEVAAPLATSPSTR
jgi:hypothetical protein